MDDAREVPNAAERLSGGARERILVVGDRVRIERDERRYPPRGSWPRWRGKVGTVAEINDAGLGAVEYGVIFGAVSYRPNGSMLDSRVWFLRHELTKKG